MKKNLIAVLAIAALISASSCKKSEDATCTLSAATLVGTYKITSSKLNGVDAFFINSSMWERWYIYT